MGALDDVWKVAHLESGERGAHKVPPMYTCRHVCLTCVLCLCFERSRGKASVVWCLLDEACAFACIFCATSQSLVRTLETPITFFVGFHPF